MNLSWDVLVVGAGPAGALAAREAARGGSTVLLVDKAVFPRPKVCGCCLNSVALSTLEKAGLGELPGRLGARPLEQIRLAAGGLQACIPLPSGRAVSREAFDHALVQEAVASGACFLPGIEAGLGEIEKDGRWMQLKNPSDVLPVRVKARVVLAADGLGGRLLQREPALWIEADSRSRIGAGAIAEKGPDFYHSGTVFMACGRGGYVGLVRLEDGRLDIAAAFDAPFLRSWGGPAKAAATVLEKAGFPPVDRLENLVWRGTPALTRRRARLSAQRLFVLGDSAGYVEPFTGEGIGWALASGLAVAPLALQGVKQWTPSLESLWEKRYCRLLAKRQRSCRLLTSLLRRTSWMRIAVAVLSRRPQFAASLVHYINMPLAVNG